VDQSSTSGQAAITAERVEIHLDEGGHFAGSLLDAADIILLVEGAIAAKEAVVVRLVVARERELRTQIAATGSPEAQVVAAKAKLAFAATERRRQALEACLRFFLVDARFRRSFVPQRERAAICLVNLINDDGQKHGADGFTKIDLFLKREPAVGTSIMLPTDALREPAGADGCRSVEQYEAKLMAFGGDTITALPERVRLELAYPAVVREIVLLEQSGHLKEEWLRPANWAFGIG
jgi:hypothetical protein